MGSRESKSEGDHTKSSVDNSDQSKPLDVIKSTMSDSHAPVQQEHSKPAETPEQTLQSLHSELKKLEKQQSELSDLVEQRDGLILSETKRKELQTLRDELNNFQQALEPSSYHQLDKQCINNTFDKSKKIFEKLEKTGITINGINAFLDSQTENAQYAIGLLEKTIFHKRDMNSTKKEIDDYNIMQVSAFPSTSKIENKEIPIIVATNLNEFSQRYTEVNNKWSSITNNANKKLKITISEIATLPEMLEIATHRWQLCHALSIYQCNSVYENFLKFSVDARSAIEEQLDKKKTNQRTQEFNTKINEKLASLGIEKKKKQSQADCLKKAEEFLKQEVSKAEKEIQAIRINNLAGEAKSIHDTLQSWEEGSLDIKPLKTAAIKVEAILKVLKNQKVETQQLETAFEDIDSWIKSSDKLLESHTIAEADLFTYKQENKTYKESHPEAYSRVEEKQIEKYHKIENDQQFSQAKEELIIFGANTQQYHTKLKNNAISDSQKAHALQKRAEWMEEFVNVYYQQSLYLVKTSNSKFKAFSKELQKDLEEHSDQPKPKISHEATSRLQNGPSHLSTSKLEMNF